MIKKINESQFDEVKNSKIAVVDFNATWCGPCKMLGPVIEEVSNEFEGKANFFAVDVDENQNLAMQNKIMSIPAIVIYKDGKEVERQVGFLPKSELIQYINNNL